MMRSLWAGVTGLQAHQIAMDVEGNNIANVNTTGFKYSRANFSDLLSQTAKIATAPQGELGGKNPMQIGLGTQISSVTKIFKQGSIETTDKNTDLAIQGDGFFVVSPDGGSTYKYTRNGDFNFDAEGNFVESNGYIIQGWMRDDDTGEIDSTAPIRNITIPPGLTTPANDTSFITLKANLNSGDSTVNKRTIYQLDSHNKWYDKDEDGLRSTSEIHNENNTVDMFNTDKELVERGLDMAVVFDATGQSLNLRDDQGIWVSYANARTTITILDPSVASLPSVLDIELNGKDITGALTGSDEETVANQIASKINEFTSQTGVVASVENGSQVVLTNNNQLGTEANMKNIELVRNASDNTGFQTTKVITAYQYTYSSTSVTSNPTYNASAAREFHTTEDLRNSMQIDARGYVNYTGARVVDTAIQEVYTMDVGGTAGTDIVINPGETFSFAGITLTANGAPALGITRAELIAAFVSGTTPAAGTLTGTINPDFTIAAGTAPNDIIFTQTVAGNLSDLSAPTGTAAATAANVTITTQGGSTWSGTTGAQTENLNDGVEVAVNAQGQFQITNPEGDAFDEQLLIGSHDISAYRDCCANSAVLFPAGTVFGAGVTITAPADRSITLILNGSSETILAGATLSIAADTTLTNEANFPQGTVFGTSSDHEEFTATFAATGAALNDTISFDGFSYTYTAAAADADAAATAFVTAYNANTNSNWTATNATGVVTFLSKDIGDIVDAIYTPSTFVVTGMTGPVVAKVVDGAVGTATIDVGTTGIVYDVNTEEDDHPLNLTITQLTNRAYDISANIKLATSFAAMQGSLISGSSIRTSQNMYAANHASSIDVYDSLGSKHTVRVEFTKIASNAQGSEWSILISVDEPGQINYGDEGFANILSGTIKFNSDGSLAAPPSPSSITFTANNGSTPNQNIALNFGTPTQFDGMTSFDAESNTSGISQDGYPGGDLSGIRVDETGTLIGSFTNGRSFGLAQVAMAKFSNNEGLESDGGNTFIQTSNSGDPVIGQAALGGRGFIQASSLEMSNVDLSRSLTQLIVIQRGYQANSKTITTADQMLQTLLQLKQ